MAFFDDEQTTDTLEEAMDDVVEGDSDFFDEGARAEEAGHSVASLQPVTLDTAVMEYFSWEEEREAKRSRRKTASNVRARRGTFVLDEPAREAVTRFLWHFGPSTPISDLSPKSMEGFQETVGTNTMDLASRLQPVKEFLRYCWKQEYTVTIDAEGNSSAQNLGNYLRIKRPTSVVRDDSRFQHEQAQTFEMTADGLESLNEELGQLNAEMPEAVQAVAAAREDKDIRENAPLEAAREYQERLKSRIDELEYQIAHAVVREERATGRAKLGSRVSVVEVDDSGADLGEAREYTLVGTTEANAAARRISVESPLGRGLLDQSADRQIEIQAPSGRKRFRLLAVTG
ncbi:MAG: transcription elongation factor GreA [Chloroflexi bacterium]|nr:transcription elongation factor GreA [Chloroflexota bacterium]MYD53685.1 transcription elongation factor GreA [Chloroflexota bacterium]